jgi:hypothetical protein
MGRTSKAPRAPADIVSTDIPIDCARMVERLARALRRRAGYTELDVPFASEIAECIVGPSGVTLGPAGSAAHFDGVRIVVPSDHQDLNGVCAHELGHYAFLHDAEARELLAGRHALEERCANWFMVALLVREPVMKRCAAARYTAATAARAMGVHSEFIDARRAQLALLVAAEG